jgi:hypothetical protein
MRAPGDGRMRVITTAGNLRATVPRKEHGREMTSDDPGVPEYRAMAAMWAYAVLIYNLQLEEAVIEFQADQVDSHTRRVFKEASSQHQALWVDRIADATRVLTVASIWRMSIARNSLLNAAAQLRKCAVALEGFGVAVPQIRDQKLIRPHLSCSAQGRLLGAWL